ncbi:hypothetical protein Hanom_Chr17g01578951 [Helianthus anomalus]
MTIPIEQRPYQLCLIFLFHVARVKFVEKEFIFQNITMTNRVDTKIYTNIIIIKLTPVFIFMVFNVKFKFLNIS